MSNDKYSGIFLRQMEAVLLIILQIFFATRALWKLGINSRIFLSFSWHVQSRDTIGPNERERKYLMDHNERRTIQ